MLSRHIRSWGGYKLHIGSNFPPPPKDNLRKEDKSSVPKVSFIRRFHCTYPIYPLSPSTVFIFSCTLNKISTQSRFETTLQDPTSSEEQAPEPKGHSKERTLPCSSTFSASRQNHFSYTSNTKQNWCPLPAWEPTYYSRGITWSLSK